MDDLDPQLRAFLTSFQRLAEIAGRTSADDGPTLTDALRSHLGVSPDRVAVVSKEVVAHRFADYDVTFERLAGPDAEVLGIGGGDQRHHMSLSDLVSNAWHRPMVGQVD